MRKDLKIGIFALVVIVVSFFVLNYLRGKDVFNREIDIIANCDNVYGLTPSAPLYIKGYKAGQVSSLTYNSEKGLFELVCSVKNEFKLPSDSKLVIYSADIMGSKAVRIDLGTSETLLKDEDTVKLVMEPGLMESVGQAIGPMISTASSTLDSLSMTLSNVRSLLSDSNIESLSSTFDNLEATMANVHNITSSVNGKSDQISSLISNLNAFSTDLKALAAKLDTTLTGVNGVVNGLDNADLEGMVASIKTLVDKVQQPEGTLGKVMNEDSLYNSIDSLLVDINLLVDRIKENPKKYLKISVF